MARARYAKGLRGIHGMEVATMTISSLLVLAAVAIAVPREKTFKEDVAFLSKHVKVNVLGKAGGPQVAVVPGYQCRVMTSAIADNSSGFGWLNYKLIESGKTGPHINVFGGEDRFWIGPEGGQFSIFFNCGDPFDLAHWQTPALIDTEAFDVVTADEQHITCKKEATIKNWSNTVFDLGIERTVRLLDGSSVKKLLGTSMPAGVKMVGFETDNRLTNKGGEAWNAGGGLLSIWILGMFNPSPTTTVVVPFKKGSEADLGPIVNDSYFGKVPAERLKVKDNLILFRGDGQYRSKIGVNPRRAMPVLGSYDSKSKVLTIVQYTLPGTSKYVNSMWALQDDPFSGDALNSYNDGPPAPGKKPLGPFYELESSSPAAALGPGKTIQHLHRTFHFTGSEIQLAKLAKAVLNADLETIKSAF